jgi:hypothetical protein
MKGSVCMRLSYAQQMDILCEAMEEKIERLNTLPKEEALKEAHDFLFDVGIIDEDGNLAEPYVKLRERYERQETQN